MTACAYCGDGYSRPYGGTFAFEGYGVVEQPIIVDMCIDHWKDFYDALAATNWLRDIFGLENSGVTLGHILREEGAYFNILNEAKILVDSIGENDHGYEETLMLRTAIEAAEREA